LLIVLEPRRFESNVLPDSESDVGLFYASKMALYPHRVEGMKKCPQASFIRALIQFMKVLPS
jgi:hypothetical protein